ncbi:hypothetical protein J437_LFUL005555 [Ladona fulva]|uniref:Integrase catalytic domain-containing protein n=1 Tax=Ladona fulva TaxID=123851 RepID=A0A8K0K6V6_LADFU|nr:hypothetical protein J437_LFUL005555 [Ladona fulva]
MSIGNTYLNPSNPSGYSGASRLVNSLKWEYTPKEVTEWLEALDPYTLHKPVLRKFARNRYQITNIDDLWQCDLIDMRNLKDQNDNYGYLLAVIDSFSKNAWVAPLKLKTGGEFTSRLVKKDFKENGVNYFVTQNPNVKASIVERFNRTLKTRMWRFFTENNTRRYIEILPKLLHGYNHAYHSSIKITPADVNEKNVYQVWKNLYGDVKDETTNPKLCVGDMVRLIRIKSKFDKGYESNWTEEIFKIRKVIKRKPVVYVVEDQKGNEIEGRFYEPELQRVRVSKTRDYKIDKILEYWGKGVRREAFVKWKGYPDTFNSWMRDQFYITLPSNSSMNSFPDNTTTRFRTQLPQRIELQGEWEVAVVEFHYPCSLLTISNGNNIIRVWNDQGGNEKFRIKPGNYKSDSYVLRELNSMNKISSRFISEMDINSNRVFIDAGSDSVNLIEGKSKKLHMTFSPRLALQLGFDPKLQISVGSVSNHPANLFLGFHHQMMIYCDIVEQQLIGDTCAPLLRIVYMDTRKYIYGSQKLISFDSPHYYYENQAGMGISSIYRGAEYQRGHGIGSFLGGIFRAGLPILSRGAKAVGKEVLRSGVNLLGDVVQNRPIRESVLRRVDEACDNLKRKAVDSIGKLMKGSGYKKRRIGHSLSGSQRGRKSQKGRKAKKKVKRSNTKSGETIKRKGETNPGPTSNKQGVSSQKD